MKNRKSNSELEITNILNEIKLASSDASTSPNSEMPVTDSATNEDSVVSNEDSVVSSDETEIPVTDSAANEDSVVSSNETEMPAAELVPDDKVVPENTALTFENKINIIKGEKRFVCTAGKHIKNGRQKYVKSFAAIRLKINNEIKWINLCENCMVSFLKLAQKCYADDNFKYLKSKTNDIINMSISIVGSSHKCSFCPDQHKVLYRIRINNISLTVCRNCFFKLINKAAKFLLYYSREEVIKSIIQYFNDNNISFDNIRAFEPFINSEQADVSQTNDDEAMPDDSDKPIEQPKENDDEAMPDDSNKPIEQPKENNDEAIPDSISLEEAKVLLKKYQNRIKIMSATIAKRDAAIENLHIANDALIDELDTEKESVYQLEEQIFSLNYSLDAAHETINNLLNKNNIPTKSGVPLVHNSKNKKGKISPSEIIQACKDIIDFIK